MHLPREKWLSSAVFAHEGKGKISGRFAVLLLLLLWFIIFIFLSSPK
ncbi:hypothetical protein [Acidisphaera sp. L21]|nr:hypothetical protein [Acidisphaera sp. L21]